MDTIFDFERSLSVYSIIIFIYQMLNLVKSIPKRYFSVSLSAKEWGLPDDYEILSSLGKGSSARVFLGANIVTGQRVVIKMFKQLPVESIRQ